MINLDVETKEEKKTDLKKAADDVLSVTGDAIGIAASPSLLWLIILWNCSGGKGFNGYISNPNASP